ncbi:MAG: aldehyde dehydrogenase [Burkholderiales bacterium]|nr:aldehyde dehydrogenase [Rhodocyclaceae bacterium]
MIEAISDACTSVFVRRNPVTGDAATRASAFGVADAVIAADAAAAAWPAWAATGPNARRGIVSRVADLLAERADTFVQAMIAETGTSVTWATFNVRGAIGALREAAALATQVGGDVIPSDKPGCLALTVRRPVGVVLGMAPWNAPLLLGMRAVVMPLVCGNSVVLKASEACPGTHWMIGELFQEAGLPRSVLQVVTHDEDIAPALVEALIAHSAVRRINFTGSTRVGRIVGELAGRHLKPALLELGGKAPLVILGDADIDQAVSAAAFGAFVNQGQICMSTERIVVDQRIADAFAQRLADKALALSVSHGGEGQARIGGLIGMSSAERVEAMVADAVACGARLLTPLRREGVRFDPVVIDQIGPGMRLYEEESFGPIAAIVRVRDEDEAVRVANDTEYGLVGAVFGRDLARTLSVAQRLQVGVCNVNGTTVSSESQLPFGGVKSSGYGRFGGKSAIAEFTDLQLLTIHTEPQTYPLPIH